MVTIRVDPDLLRENSRKFLDVGSNIENVKRAIDSALSQRIAPEYDVQLKAQLISIGLESAIWSSSIGNRISSHAEKLSAISAAFENADNNSLTGLSSMLVEVDQWAMIIQALKTGARLDNVTLTKILSLLHIGNLGGLLAIGIPVSVLVSRMYFDPTNKGLSTTNLGNVPSGNSEEVKPVPVKSLPTPVPLASVERIKGEQCARYAQRRRPTLGRTGASDGGAYNYKNRPTAFQISSEDNDLTSRIAPGYAIIWDNDHPDMVKYGNTLGHVAIVEKVEGNRVLVSQANWTGKDEMWLTLDQLQSKEMYVLP